MIDLTNDLKSDNNKMDYSFDMCYYTKNGFVKVPKFITKGKNTICIYVIFYNFKWHRISIYGSFSRDGFNTIIYSSV